MKRSWTCSLQKNSQRPNGDIRVSAELDNGGKFVVSLPLKQFKDII